MLTTNDIIRLLTCYDLGSSGGIIHARRGFVNETAFVQTDQGRVVIRRIHRRLAATGLNYRHTLMKWLAKHDFPTGYLIAARDGTTLIELDGRSYEVMTFVSGEDFNAEYHPGQIFAAGELLARYHQAIEGFPPPPELVNPRYSAQTVMGLTERLLERDAMGELQETLSWYDLRAARLRKLLAPESYAQLPQLVIHGDIHADNFLFAGDQATALIDFDQVAWDARIADIADGLVGFATDARFADRMAWGVFRGPLHVEYAADFMAGYTSIEPLTATELQTLPILLELIWLQGELGRVLATSEGAPDYHQDVLGQGCWLAKWTQDHKDELVAKWTAINAEHARQPARAA